MVEAPTNMLQLARGVCGTQAGKLRAALQRLLHYRDAEAVHDVRVACRRLRVALQIVRRSFGRPRIEALREPLKELLTLLGGARDAEVLAARVKRLADSGDRGAPDLLRALELQIEKHRGAALEAIARGVFAALPEQIENLLAQPLTDSARALEQQNAAPVRRAQLVLAKHLRTLQQLPRLDGSSLAARLHELRIEMKKLRYAAEFFAHGLAHKAPAAPPNSAAPAPPQRRAAAHPLRRIVKLAEGYQQSLGELHDAVVTQETLSRLLHEGPPPAQPAPGPAAQAGHPAYSPVYYSVRALLEGARADEARLRREFGKSWGAGPLRRLQRTIKAIGTKDVPTTTVMVQNRIGLS
ncbi:MAG: CHAD domain-containing protein [Planctomycetota bacterium]